jgi:FkbM family methyltransferase
MGLKTALSNKLSHWALKTKKVRRAILRDLWKDDVLFFRQMQDHCLIYYPHDVIGEQITQGGEYGRGVVSALSNYLNQEGAALSAGTVLEIGANIGTHTVYFFRDLGCTHVIALEPDPQNYDLLTRNVKLNNLGDRVTHLQLGASSTSGQLPFVSNEMNRGGSRIGDHSDEAIVVDITTVDRLLEQYREPFKDLSLIWIDVEGHELQVLKGALKTLQTCSPAVFLEYTPAESSANNQKLRDLLFDHFDHVIDFGRQPTPLTAQSFDAIQGQTDLLAFKKRQ